MSLTLPLRDPIASRTLTLRVRGPFALFTDPAFKVERVSAPVMTPTAARGILSAIVWKPAFVWQVLRIRVLAPIRFVSIRRNELTTRVPAIATQTVADGGTPPVSYIEDDRTRRHSLVLRDVDFVVDARILLTPNAGPSDNIAKFVEMFRRRVEKGQCYNTPYLGCREFPADFGPAEDAPPPIPDTRPLGRMLWDVEYGPLGRPALAHFFDAFLDAGVLEVPMMPTVRALGRA